MLSLKLYCLFHLLSVALAGGGRRDIRGRYTREVKEYELVVPKKVSENGDFISYHIPHFYNIARVRRGADSGKVHYIVPINGRDRVLELLPSEGFHAPGMVIEHHEQDARNNLNSVKLRRPRKANCYYHGTVRDVSRSSAAITACSGLVGSISMGAEQYLIEPVEDDGTPTEGPQHRHLVYRRDVRQFINRSTCGTSGTFERAFQERMEWEEKFGYQIEKGMTGMNDIDEDIPTEASSKRKKKWCTTCIPEKIMKCQTPYPACLIERPLFIEMMIVVGPRLAEQEFLDEDVEQYVNTVVNIAVRHFMDASVGRPVQLKLVRVITLGFLYPDLDSTRYTADDLLQRFCDWQLHFNPSKEGHPNHHDFALYLVKFKCQNVLGLTNMAGMCRPDKSCGVVSAEGLLAGHILTHMIGHSLGADHDEIGKSGCCPEEPDGTCYHMGINICSKSSAFSICSKQCMGKFMESHAAWCMQDAPTSIDITEPTLLPGQVYTAAEQCRINFDMDTYACLVGEFCKRLYCKVSDEECASTGDPPAQGTRCGPDQWCFNGRCVHRGTRPGATNGEWGVWSPWTPCTKTCGGGIQTSQRSCDSPAPTQSGRLCPGAWLKNRMCNIGPCMDAGKGFLDQQCRATNVRPYHGRKHEWLYFNQQLEDLKCVVMCINERQEVAVRFPVAIDGTYCNPGSKDVCIRGVCTSVGCDWVIGSKAKEDACGVCHGNGTECRIMQGFFSETDFQGKMAFLKLPIGTRMIMIRETRPSPCYFVIMNSLNSTYYLNHDDAESQTDWAGGGIFRMKSTVGIYQVKADMERIFIKDSLAVPITVSMVCKEEEPSIGILYQYALPEVITISANYTWEYLSWEKCPALCGGAIQRSMPVCVEAQGGEVEDTYCAQQKKPNDKIRVCNPRPCDAKWWVGPWVECECYNNNGITTRMVMCAHMKETQSYYIKLMAEEECVGIPKPTSIKPCDPKKNQALWIRKGYTRKRHITDMIPYSKAVENYSIWDEVPGESHPYMRNVRHLFQSIDPENIHDYLYLKKIGMTRDLWERIHREVPQRVRRRRRASLIRIETPGSKMHEAAERKLVSVEKVATEKSVTGPGTHRPVENPGSSRKKAKNQDTGDTVKQFQIDFAKENRLSHDQHRTTVRAVKKTTQIKPKNQTHVKSIVLIENKSRNLTRKLTTSLPTTPSITKQSKTQAKERKQHTSSHPGKHPKTITMRARNLKIGVELRNMRPAIVKVSKESDRTWQGEFVITPHIPDATPIDVKHRKMGTAVMKTTPMPHKARDSKDSTVKIRYKMTAASNSKNNKDATLKLRVDKISGHWTTQIVKNPTHRKISEVEHHSTVDVERVGVTRVGTEATLLKEFMIEVERPETTKSPEIREEDKFEVLMAKMEKKVTSSANPTAHPTVKTVGPSKTTTVSAGSTRAVKECTSATTKTVACSTSCPKSSTCASTCSSTCASTCATTCSTTCTTTCTPEAKKIATEKVSTLTVPMVNPGDPGQTPFPELASETPVPQDQCWKSEVKPLEDPVPCRTKEEAQPEPAEQAPELDFFNTSNVKYTWCPSKRRSGRSYKTTKSS